MVMMPAPNSKTPTDKSAVTGDVTPQYKSEMAQTGMTQVLNKGVTPQVYSVQMNSRENSRGEKNEDLMKELGA